MSGTFLRATGDKPDRNSRQVVESAIELTKGSKTGGWVSRSVNKGGNPRSSQWETPLTAREQAIPQKDRGK